MGVPTRTMAAALAASLMAPAPGGADPLEGFGTVMKYGMPLAAAACAVDQDRFGEFFEVEGVGLTARCFCHELDHLDGRLFVDIADHIMDDEEMAAYYGGTAEEEE